MAYRFATTSREKKLESLTRLKLPLYYESLLSRPVGLDFHTEAGFDFSDFFPLANPSENFRDVTIWFYPIYCMFIQGIIRKKLYV